MTTDTLLKKKILTERLWLDLNMYLTFQYFGSHHRTWVMSKEKTQYCFWGCQYF